MYHIRYKDPMTGVVLETQAASLPDAVNAIQKAKDDLYYRGHALQETPANPAAADEHKLDHHHLDDDDASDSSDDLDEEYDLDSYLYPYGVTLW